MGFEMISVDCAVLLSLGRELDLEVLLSIYGLLCCFKVEVDLLNLLFDLLCKLFLLLILRM